MSLTKDLRRWRKDRNITKADYLVFMANVLEELLEPIYDDKQEIEYLKQRAMNLLAYNKDTISKNLKELDVVDCIQDIIVFSTNEIELMGYDNERCNLEVFRHISCRKQNPIQKEQWLKFGAYGKWEKDRGQDHKEIYEPNYESCKL